MLLKDKIAIVTGAGRGIGRGIAVRFAAEGAKVAVATRTAEYGKTVVDDIRASGGEAILISTELQNAGEVDRIVAETVRAFGGLDIAVHNAALAQIQRVAELTDDHLDAAFAVNVKAGVWLTRAALAPMRQRGGGRLLFTSSVTAHRTITGAAAYSISKAGLNAFIRSAAFELAAEGITVNGVEPGAIETDALKKHNFTPEQKRDLVRFIPVGRMGEADDVARAMAFLASPGAAYVTGQTLIVDGGMMLPENGAFARS